MWAWWSELLEIRHWSRERAKFCESCEILKVELAQVRREKERLLNHILQPQSENTAKEPEKPEPILPKHIPWRVKQQELEARDRVEAQRIMNQFKNRAKGPVDTEKLEKDMGISG